MNFHAYLSFSIWLPIIMGCLVALTEHEVRRLTLSLSLLGAVLSFLVTLPLYAQFSSTTPGMQFVELVPWIKAYNINYSLGIDGISLWFVLLNSFVTILVVIAGWVVIRKHLAQYMAAFLISSGLINGIFESLDAVLFYVFFEATLIPMFLIIGMWGGPQRVYASIKFFLYTLMGSLLMLAAFIYLYFEAGRSFDILKFQALSLALPVQIMIFLAFFASFAVKAAMWPFHTWLPDAHVEAPTGGSVILAAITLKTGAYGFLRFSLPITPNAAHTLSGMMIGLSLVAIIYVALVALIQKDMKKLIAYSSVSHMGFVTLGIFMFNTLGIEGSILQMISHAFVSIAMFLCIGVLYDRMHTRDIKAYGGVANTMPVFAAFLMLFAMASAGLPGTSGFVGEFTVILGAIKVNFWYALLASLNLVFGAAYILWMYKRVIFGEVANAEVAQLEDVTAREKFFLAIIVVLIIAMGLYPQLITSTLHTSVNQLIQQSSAIKY
ncbi:MAG: NADH-quinone oxidoreductase subunit M [Ferrovum sp. 37-45-19]|uniref:NADH-quinone oxidoreductase subunit M n=1 Tax=Ferrovum sp. JA12 TaxID=1356299 RepID=UPI0007028EBB|nr:NADH-quinone oxidoreductase subunit M [Ferrovum sp. JA12]OYV79663.1 MAG: NADH-quinone oxidoreductase subunit M [Ferrovum sp. 21-44-67]OYV94355.1 MAG: NADH-quinone oxidoreductase subunit M [Ferrovum sp. 37-45-19]OZB32346.1 MAG: NADH-quinone oxidoreductase subunit M [Ferrovum sp. 34-44-207]HQT80613.1 NADH-quinone oxidoreductase subunit M [Ferrovaceae bacterium]KRH79702.1 NADH-quinone oxidoreductase subunit M [Ferrovum sp. JA12]